MADHARIEDLRRRIERDPASIAFAQLAEEYRRAGEYELAVRTCRAGLAQHPAYLSARVTLGRALLELGRDDEAETELEDVLRTAPDNLSAIRALAELHQRRGGFRRRRAQLEDMPDTGAPAEAPLDAPERAAARQAGERTEAADPAAGAPEGAAAAADVAPPRVDPGDPVLAELERWLAVLLADRAQRGAPEDARTRG